MAPPDSTLYYRHGGAALLRAAVASIENGPGWWPDLDVPEACQEWLRMVWSRPEFADGVLQSSTGLARRVEELLSGQRPNLSERELRRACTSVMHYALRATGRPTPFGLFAGTAPITLGGAAAVRWGDAHQPMARVDTQWLADVIARLESIPGLLTRLAVQFSNLAVRRGSRIETPFGPQRASVSYTKAVRAIREGAAEPVRVSELTERLLAEFPGGQLESLHGLLLGLVSQGFLITSLRAPFTVTDPLSFLLERLDAVGAVRIPAAERYVETLGAIRTAVNLHNTAGHGDRQRRAEIMDRMAELSSAGRCPLAVDLLLDCDLRIPEQVAEEMQHAASAMLRLSRRPAGDAAWQDFHTRFIERYGTGVLVPVSRRHGSGRRVGLPGVVSGERRR